MVRVIGILLVIAVLIVGGLTLYDSFNAATHSPQYLTEQEKLDLQKQEADAEFWMHVKYTLLYTAVGIAIGWLGLRYSDKLIDVFQILKSQQRSENGEHALIFRTETVRDRYGRKRKVRVVLNPNNTIGHGLVWDEELGQYVPMTGEQPLEFHLTHQIARARSVHTMGAMFPGDQAYVNGEVKVVPKLFGGAVNAMYKDRKDDVPEIEAQEQNLLPPPQLLTPMDAYNQSDLRYWIIGQNPETGCLAKFDLIRDHNMFVIGVPGQGKSASTLMQAAAQTLKGGHHLLLLDGKGGSDFGPLKKHCEYYKTDGDVVFEQMQVLFLEYKRRQDILNEHEAPNLTALRKAHGIEIPHLVVIFDEFGATLRDFLMRTTGKGSAEKIKALQTKIGLTMRMGRAAGIHWVIGDQNATDLTPDMLTALHLFVVAFKLDKRQNGLIDEQKAIHLRPGQFVLNGEQFNAFHFAPEMPALLRTLQPQAFPRLLESKPAPQRVEEPDPNRRPVTIVDSTPSTPLRSPVAVAYAPEAPGMEAPTEQQPIAVSATQPEIVSVQEAPPAKLTKEEEAEQRKVEEAEWQNLILDWIAEDVKARFLDQYDATTDTATGYGASEVGRLMAAKRAGAEAWEAMSEDDQQKAGDDLKSQASRMLQKTRKWMYHNGRMEGYKFDKVLPKGKKA